MQKNGAEILLDILIDEGVDTIFGYPGGACLPIYDALYKYKDRINHILVKHEQAAVHAAEGYARSTGKIGVVLLTSGPGATNGVTGVANAFCDSTPILCISGQVFSSLIGNDAFQEVDIIGITKPITKHNYLVRSVHDIAKTTYEALFLALHEKPGPIWMDITKDAQSDVIDYQKENYKLRSSVRSRKAIDESKIKEIVELMRNAKKPVLYCGGGFVASKNANSYLNEIVSITNFPVTETLMGLGTLDEKYSKQNLGMLGMHGTYEANKAMHECDLMIALGARFDDRVTSDVTQFSPNSKKVHIDIDPVNINKIVRVDIGIVADLADALKMIVDELRQEAFYADIDNWWYKLEEYRSAKCLDYKTGSKSIKPQEVIKQISELFDMENTIITTDVGMHQMWAAQHFKFKKNRQFITSGGLGTMGFGLPAAIGAKVANPDKEVVCISGDGSMFMKIQELATSVDYNIPIKVVVLNNTVLGMVKQWQDIFYNSRHSNSKLNEATDFTKIAKSFGANGAMCEKNSDLKDAVKKMKDSNKTYVLDVRISKDEHVYPMILAGASHGDMLLAPENGGKK